MMKRLLTISVVLLSQLLIVSGQGEIQFNRKNTENEIARVFVLASDSEPCEGTDLSSQSIAEYAEVALLSQYEILERKHLQMILQEQKLGMSGLIFEDQAVEAGCLQGSEGIVFCSVGCLSGQTMTKIKLVDCRESAQHWSAVGIDAPPALIVAEILENLQSGRLSNVVKLAESSEPERTDIGFRCGQDYEYFGHAYSTVEIGGRCWFAENLRNYQFSNGDFIPENLDADAWSSATEAATGIYGEGNSDCLYSMTPQFDACEEARSLKAYGRLYNWYAVSDERGLCPSGWSVPTDSEWYFYLIKPLGGAAVAGRKMKSPTGWDANGSGTNESGFMALPGGARSRGGTYNGAGAFGQWWTADSEESQTTYLNTPTISSYMVDNALGLSVRCIRDR